VLDDVGRQRSHTRSLPVCARLASRQCCCRRCVWRLGRQGAFAAALLDLPAFSSKWNHVLSSFYALSRVWHARRYSGCTSWRRGATAGFAHNFLAPLQGPPCQPFCPPLPQVAAAGPLTSGGYCQPLPLRAESRRTLQVPPSPPCSATQGARRCPHRGCRLITQTRRGVERDILPQAGPPACGSGSARQFLTLGFLCHRRCPIRGGFSLDHGWRLWLLIGRSR